MMPWVMKSLAAKGGRAHFIEIAKDIWAEHRSELERSGDFFYKWQYEMRWAGDQLSRKGKLKKIGSTGIWELLGT